MKKLLDSKFLFIVALSTIVLIVLGVLAFYLFDDSDDVFVKSGYVLNPLSEKSEKYFFDDGTSYHDNLSSMIVFDDVDKNQVSVFKESFVHYMDDSLSFLKKGAILDLDSIKGKDAVKFYNITSKSLINKKDNQYVIENEGKDIILKDFIGRISDNKYIVVGALEAKIPGNEKNISGDYFEIVYTDEGIINIENKDVKFQVAAEGSYIYIGNVVIDLGDKKITKDGEDVMSITAITISGNENIDIIPKAPLEDDNGDNGDDTNTNNQNDNQIDNQNDNQEDGTGTGNEGNDDSGEKTEIVETEPLEVSLSDSAIQSTNIKVTFDVDNYKDDDILSLIVTNLDAGRTVNKYTNIETGGEITVNLLSPSTKYLFTVVNENDGSKYFQKIFETNDFGIGLEKTYVSSNEIGYMITVSEDSEINNARLTLKKFNEDTNENEVVESVELKDAISKNKGSSFEKVFRNLDSDTIYTAVLDNFSVATTAFNDIYNVSLTSLTLKETPDFGELKKEENDDNFKLYLDNIQDNDNAIVKYTYNIYENKNTDSNPITITKTDASPAVVYIGDGDGQLKYGVNYFYKVGIEYFDNEKYVEYVRDGQINLFKGDQPSVIISVRPEDIEYDKFTGTITLIDNSCLISMPGRECDGASTLQIDIRKRVDNAIGASDEEGYGTGWRSVKKYPFTFKIDEDGNMLPYTFTADKLEPGATYSIYVSSVRNNQPEQGMQTIYEKNGPKIVTTKNSASFIPIFENGVGERENPIDINLSFESITSEYTLTADETIDLIRRVRISLYNGETVDELAKITDVDIYDIDRIKEMFTGTKIDLLKTFEMDVEALKKKSKNEDGQLSEYYTIYFEAFYDTKGANPVTIGNKDNPAYDPYYIDINFRIADIGKPKITIDPIKKQLDDSFDSNLEIGTIVGYKIIGSEIDRLGLIDKYGLTVKNVNVYVYNDKKEKVDFYFKNSDGKLELIKDKKYTIPFGQGNSFNTEIYVGNGTNSESDLIMARGNKYYIGYDVECIDENSSPAFFPDNDNKEIIPLEYGVFDEKIYEISKSSPKINYLYPVISTKDNKITYRYSIVDVDKAIYNVNNNYKLYYIINNGEENEINITTLDGEFTIDNLNNGNSYTIGEKLRLIKSENTEDILNKPISYENRLFDGYYNASDSKYNFNFEIINNPTKDNKVIIKILASDDTSDDILDRILSYQVDIKDSLGHSWSDRFGSNIVWDKDLVKCKGEATSDKKRCFEIPYTSIKEMKSEGTNTNIITVSIKAVYDNGLMGMGYEELMGSDDDTRYMILQENSIKGRVGEYYIINIGTGFSKRPNNTYPYDYYTFSIDDRDKDKLYLGYTSIPTPNNKVDIPIKIGIDGYELSSTGDSIIPKMVSIRDMGCSNNTFSFSSIIPTVRLENKAEALNGAKIDLKLSGASAEDFCADIDGNKCNTTNDNKKMYIAIWDNQDKVGNLDDVVIPLVPISFVKNKNNDFDGIYDNIIIYDLLPSTTYYYQVYTYMNNNGNKQSPVPIFGEADSNGEIKPFNDSFTTRSVDDMLDSYSINYMNNDDENAGYNDKLINTNINLKPYNDRNIQLKFNVSYVLCEYDFDKECNLENNLLKRDITETELSMNDTIDIKAIDNFEFNKKYLVKFYLTYRYYDKYASGENKYKYATELFGAGEKSFEELKAPEDFNFSRAARRVDDDYVIDLRMYINDKFRVINNGKYFIKVTDDNENIVGNLQVLDDGNYVTVVTARELNKCLSSDVVEEQLKCAFDASDVNKSIRISGLNESTKYTITLYAPIYLNNANVENKNQVMEIEHPLYSTNSSNIGFDETAYYTATADSVTVIFPLGSNLDNIESVDYTIIHFDSSKIIAHGSYITKGEDANNSFQAFSDVDDLTFVINPDGLQLEPKTTYVVKTRYHYYNVDKELYDSYSIENYVQYKIKDNNSSNG